MLVMNTSPERGRSLEEADASTLGPWGTDAAQLWLQTQAGSAETPLLELRGLAAELGVANVHVKDEGQRLGLGSFKALGGAYAVACLVVEEASRRLGRRIGFDELASQEVATVASSMTVACATDGNHGRSVAQGASRVGAKAAIFVHSGVSDERVAAIAHFGAEMIRVDGNYDDSIARAAEVAGERGWIVVSDTSWPGYERIPSLVMQGYTLLVRETLLRLLDPPTHVFLQIGVGGFAAAVAGHMALVLGDRRPTVVVVDPARAACLVESAKAGRPVKVGHGEPTVMAMLECYEPSLVAWRVLSRVADAFMTVDEGDALAAMNRLARPVASDPAIVAGESGGVGLAGFATAMRDPEACRQLRLDEASRVLVINTEGATDPRLYRELVGFDPDQVRMGPQNSRPQHRVDERR
ncbi:diaminopropionate ammonia-lyase [uncultured Aureimonas sp.]|uniref:diaminopropionate ammonia-lyase n=1 Tax=uncultured Aureimonas sp. TaxID=1604662 RepID=UPI0026013E08|nr:diaminopropionate ammonia-lyase [uncultured Aureimonas sp.]